MSFGRYISVIQRRQFVVDDSQAYMMPLVEPLFLIETHMTFEERIELFRLALAMPDQFVACEVGSYFGASTSFLAAAASLKGGTVHAVDTWKNDAMTELEPVEDTFIQFQENTRLFRHLITIHRGNAAAMKDQVPPVDLLFIDGDHSYEGTRENLVNYSPKIKPGGLLVLHDMNYESVSRALTDSFPPDSLVTFVIKHTLHAFTLKPADATG